MNHHNSFVMIINAALGDGKDSPAPSGPPARPGENGVKDLAAGHADVNAAVAAINRAMLMGG